MRVLVEEDHPRKVQGTDSELEQLLGEGDFV